MSLHNGTEDTGIEEVALRGRAYPVDPVKWFRFRVVSVLLIAATGAVACAPTAGAPTAPTGPSSAATVANAPQPGGVIPYASTSKVNNLHPFKAQGAVERRGLGPVYDLLLSYKYDGGDYTVAYEVAPWLAERWEQPDPTTYVFHLRKGVKWHDGQPFTADDVVFTYDFVRDPRNAFPIRSQLSPVDRIQNVDSYTVRMTTKAPSPFILQRLADLNMFILPKHVVARGDDLARVAVGTGPFKLKSFDSNSKSEFVRNDDYWQPGKPYLDGIVVYWTLEESARAAGFIARELDLWGSPDRRQAETLRENAPGIQIVGVKFALGYSMSMRLGGAPFNDLRVRRALHLAVDRAGLVKTAGLGEGIINPPGMPGHKEGFAIAPDDLLKLPGYRQPKDQDLAEARRLLAEAGVPAGTKWTILYDSNADAPKRMAEPIAERLRQVGIQIELSAKNQPEFAKDWQDGNYQIALERTAEMQLNKRQLPFLHSRGSQNTMGLADPKLDSILEGIEIAMEVEEQKRLAVELQRYLLETLYIIPTIDFWAYQLLQPWVRDHQMHQSAAAFMDQAAAATTWIDQEVKRKYKP